MNQFTNYVELQAEKAENLSFCRGIKLLHIRDKVETMLGFIGKGGIFEESGLKEEIGVKNFGGIYIQSNTELCEYLIKVIDRKSTRLNSSHAT